MRELGTPERRHQDFTAALYQFLLPTVAISTAGNHERLPGFPFFRQLDKNLLSALDAPYQQPHASIRTRPHGGMCKNVRQVQRPPLLLPPVQPTTYLQHQRRTPYVPQPRGSTTKRKRTKTGLGAQDDQQDGQPGKKRKRTEKRRHFDRLKRLREFI